MTTLTQLRALAEAATPGPWCYESCGEKGDGSNLIGVVYGPGDEDCQHPLSGRLQEWDEGGNEIDYYRDELVAECRHSSRNSGANAAYVAALSPPVVLAMIDVIEAAKAMFEAGGVSDEDCAFEAALARLEQEQSK